MSLTHPCFETPGSRWVFGDDGTVAREISSYFDEGRWYSDHPGGVRGRAGAVHRQLSTCLNAAADAGFILRRVVEPRGEGEVAEQFPGSTTLPPAIIWKFAAGS